MNTRAQACIPPLVDLGFTEVEAAAYTFLVQYSPATGYRVAQGIGKPVANTYKAIHSLRTKGAVIVDETGHRRCRAVPPIELLGMLEERRRQRVEEASRMLSGLEPAAADEGVYALRSRAQTLERARDMLTRAREVVLLDLFPESVEQLRKPIEAAARRGVAVAALVYEPAELRKVEVICNPEGDLIRERWPGQWLNLVIDGSEHLLAFFIDGGGQAIWSRSTSLSWIYHGGLWSEMTTARLTAALDQGASLPTLRRLRKHMQQFLRREVRGYHQLHRRLLKGRTSSPSSHRGPT